MIFRPLHGLPALACLLASLLVMACSEGNNSSASGPPASGQAAPPKVAVQVLKHQEIEVHRQWLATLTPLDHHLITAPVAGEVTHLPHRVADRVEAGALLARIEAPGTRRQQDALHKRRTTLEAEVQRWERLRTHNAAGSAEVEAARLRLLEVESALAELDAALGARRIAAPVAGIITHAPARKGLHVGVDQPLLTLTDQTSMGTRLTIASTDVAYFQTPDELRVQRRQKDATDQTTLAGPVRVAFQEAPQPGYVVVELRIDGIEGSIPVDVEIIAADRREVLLVPWTAIAVDDDRRWVGVVTGEPGMIERRTVTLGQAYAQGVEVLSGLNAGDAVLLHEPRNQPEGREVTAVEGR